MQQAYQTTFWGIYIVLAVIGVLCLIYMTVADGHESAEGFLYPPACCGGQDCKSVPCTDLVEDGTGWLYIPGGNRFNQDQVHPSQDRHCHICVNANNISRCAFIQNGV